MNRYLKIGILSLICIMICSSAPVYGSANPHDVRNFMSDIAYQNTSIQQIMETESDFKYFIYEDFGIEYMGIYDTDDVTEKLLENRNGFYVCERCIGIVLNSNYDGIITNTKDLQRNYIAYRNINLKIKRGDVILTYFVYNPDTNYTDDIIHRYDFKIGEIL